MKREYRKHLMERWSVGALERTIDSGVGILQNVDNPA